MAIDNRGGTMAADSKNQMIITSLLLAAFFGMALFFRSYFNFDGSINGGIFRWSGTDGYYHQRVVDHLLLTGEFLLRDTMINYPVGATNPRPPFFVWTAAAVSGLLAPLFGGSTAMSSGYVLAFVPAFWGALTVFPMYVLGKEAFGRRAGLWAAFLIAFTPGHLTRSNLGGLDHDSAILFFLVLAALFFVKALKLMDRGDYITDWRDTAGVSSGLKRFFAQNKAAVAYSLLAGAALSTIALTWKGYPYAFAIVAVWYGFQLLAGHLRHRDNTGYMILAILPFLVSIVMIWPYYAAVGRIASAVYPMLYIFVGVLVASLVFVPTRHLPPVVVLPAMLGSALIGLLLLLFVFPDIGDLFFTGLGYFVQTKLYTTIAEAQRTQLGYLVFSVGIVPFFFALAGIGFAISSFVRKRRDDHLFVLVWAAIGLFMAFTATRFVFNATVAFALLAGWVIDRFIQWVRFSEVVKTWRNARHSGTGVPRSVTQSLRTKHVLSALFLAFVLVLPNVWLSVDAGIPGLYLSRSVNDAPADEQTALREFYSNYFGAFGQDFLSSSWIRTTDYLADQDVDLAEADRPAFIAWWDYGFYAAQRGDHPAVADPFQFGFEVAGRVIASQSEEEAVSWFIIRMAEADVVHNGGTMTARTAAVFDDVQPGLSGRVAKALANPRDYDRAFGILSQALTGGGFGLPDDAAVTDLYQAVRGATGHDIRYFALDGRMFPCDDSRTPSVDSGSIFYAPVFLADKNPDDFAPTIYRDPQGTAYTLRLYESTPNNGSRAVEEAFVEGPTGQRFLISGQSLLPMSPQGGIDYENALTHSGGITIQEQELDFQEAFYQSFLYRAWVGARPSDPSAKMPDGHEYAPGLDLKHFRLIHTTARVPDNIETVNKCAGNIGGRTVGYTNGVSLYKYYHGAPVSGVVRDQNGVPIAGVDVVVEDNFGIGHDKTVTDDQGRYTVLAPFSTDVAEPSDIASSGDAPDLLRSVGPNQLVISREGVEISRETFSVTDAQSMRVEPYTATHDFTVEPGSVEGLVFQDLDGDGVFNATTDEPLADATVTFGSVVVTSDAAGRYLAEDVLPGQYQARYEAEGFVIQAPTVTVRGGETTTHDQGMAPEPITVRGSVTHDGTPVPNLRIIFERVSTATTSPTNSDFDGNYTLDLAPGGFQVSVDMETLEGNDTVRYFTEEPYDLTLTQGQGEAILDIQVQRQVIEEG